MDEIHYVAQPSLHEPAMVAGFGGWGNAGEVATSTINYMVERLQAEELATFRTDDFSLFSVNRPLVTIHNGHLKSLDLPRSRFYYSTRSQGPDLIFFFGPEPQLRWNQYVKAFMELCHRYQVRALITLGGLHDEVLHSEEKISAAGASLDDVQKLRELDEPVGLIDYIGPSAIHSLLLAEAQEANMQSISIWAHAASYLQGTNYKLCAALIRRLNQLLHLEIDSSELELSWRLLEEQIEALIAKNDQLRQHVEDLKTGDERGSFASPPSSPAKVIRLDEFIKQSKPEE